MKTGFEPRFTDADVVRVAHCQVHEDRVEHFALMQEKVWNPAMAGFARHAARGRSGRRRGTSSWCCRCGSRPPSTASTGTERVERLALRAQIEADVAALTGDIVQLEPSWTV